MNEVTSNELIAIVLKLTDMTQAELAAHLGVSRQAMDYRVKANRLTLDQCNQLAASINIDLLDLIRLAEDARRAA